MKEVHNEIVGHCGLTEMVRRLKERNSLKGWMGYRAACFDFIRKCSVCQLTRGVHATASGELHTTTAFEPFYEVAVDQIGPFPVDSNNNKYIMIFQDCFTRFVELVPTPDGTEISAAAALLTVFGRYGAAKYIRTDNGSNLVASK